MPAPIESSSRGGGPPAYATGSTGHVPLANVVDFCLSQPFQTENDFTPPSQRLSPIEDSRPIFVENKSDRTLTFGQTFKDARAVASGLLNLGLEPRDLHKLPPTPTCPQGPEIAQVVLIQLPNCLAFAPVILGTVAAGLTATLASPALTGDEIAWILQNSRPRVIVTAKTCLPAMRAALQKQQDQAFFKTVPIFAVDGADDPYPQALPKGPAPKSVIGEKDWRELLAANPSPRLDAPIFPANTAATRTAVILWSSGTSGRSKGVLLSHHALNVATASLWQDSEFYQGQRQRWLGYVPFYHVFGLCNVLLLAICTGSTTYTMSSFNLDAVLAAIPSRKITYLHMAPPVAVMLAKSPKVEPYTKRDASGRNGFSSVVGAVTGGAPLGHEVVVQLYQRCGFRVRLGYGLSETCCTALQRGLGEAEMHAHAGDTGRPHWGVDIMIAGGTEADGKAVGAAIDHEGEVLVRGPMLMSAYLPIGFMASANHKNHQLDMSATTEALTPDGWFRTGDVGALSADGRLRITDRLKELIKVRAYQVAPAELEAVLCSSESVADAGVIGIYDESEATEWPRAFVVPSAAVLSKPDRQQALAQLAQEVKKLVEERTTKYKWLVGGVVFVDQIPKSPSGKILRRLLKSGGPEAKGVEIKLYERKRRDVKL
ncbi:hypothetical protein B0T26DRAFT_737735 [Lasiosphaeria miniovina]|uniref:Acetyl-CoA synthetase-like protein n=1 Tax=Lasiosphaeria miniovina TaxID=1954250 RepID=A0AA40B391_9PEZI|nr:uncharacterized protein B0T26DRAFT_737735 [Lasiosphaeria miniovina]KAK0726856.1 hypothetical protein B0T26DRAFT_737735 [Lasiosphaeria miniovina]